MESDVVHVGKDGVDLSGRWAIMIVILAMFASGAAYILYAKTLEDTEFHKEQREATRSINQRLESLQADHAKLVEATNRVGDQMELSNWIQLATPEQEKRARESMTTPKLLRRTE